MKVLRRFSSWQSGVQWTAALKLPKSTKTHQWTQMILRIPRFWQGKHIVIFSVCALIFNWDCTDQTSKQLFVRNAHLEYKFLLLSHDVRGTHTHSFFHTRVKLGRMLDTGWGISAADPCTSRSIIIILSQLTCAGVIRLLTSVIPVCHPVLTWIKSLLEVETHGNKSHFHSYTLMLSRQTMKWKEKSFVIVLSFSHWRARWTHSQARDLHPNRKWEFSPSEQNWCKSSPFSWTHFGWEFPALVYFL